MIAKHRLEQLKQRQTTQGPPEETWKWIPGIFGFPVETETDPLRTQPWLTWVLALAITAASLCGFSNLNAAVNALGFVPADPMRWGGLTFFSSFFLHGGLLHLLGNLYFLLIFGDNVEDFLGRKRYGLLILASALTGDLVHLALAGASDIPCIGASAGISGIIVFYALKFPQARLGILFRFSLLFRWVQIPAWGALVLWLLLQFLLVSLELHGLGDVAASAHLGGAAAGFLLWLRWRYSERQTDDPGESGNGR